MAAQAQPGAVGKSFLTLAHGARLCAAGDGERRALARARHLAFLRRTHDRTGCPPWTLDFALIVWAGLIDKLLIYPANMQKNLDRLGGLVHSQRLLIALTQKGCSREDAYKLVQRNAMPVWRGEGDFQTLLKQDSDVKSI